MTQVSPQNFPPVHLSTQPTFTFNFDDATGVGLSPNPDPVSQRRPSTGSHSTSLAELAVEKSAPGKRSLTKALPTSHTRSVTTQCIHTLIRIQIPLPVATATHSCTCTLPHPITITTASSVSDISFIIAHFTFVYSFLFLFTLILVQTGRLPVSFLSTINPVGCEPPSFHSV